MRDNMQRDTRMNTAGRPSLDSSRIARLGELDDYKVADGEPDIRGWDVKTATGQRVGKVKELIVDTGAMKARYLDVELDRKAVGLPEDRHVLVPVGTARLDDKHDDVIIRESAAELRDAPVYNPDSFNPEYERTVQGWHGRRAPGTAGAPASGIAGLQDTMFDDSALRRKRDGAGRTEYLTRSEEELAVGKRQVKAGEVDVRKRVEMEQVQEQVPVTREEVTVERRPIRAGDSQDAKGEGDIGDRDIRVPLMAEELVVDKRAVPKEEVVIRKHTVQDEKTVKANVKKERVDVRPTGDVREGR
jgi:uncharacterized protein (TIGR02271 family)